MVHIRYTTIEKRTFGSFFFLFHWEEELFIHRTGTPHENRHSFDPFFYLFFFRGVGEVDWTRTCRRYGFPIRDWLTASTRINIERERVTYYYINLSLRIVIEKLLLLLGCRALQPNFPRELRAAFAFGLSTLAAERRLITFPYSCPSPIGPSLFHQPDSHSRKSPPIPSFPQVILISLSDFWNFFFSFLRLKLFNQIF